MLVATLTYKRPETLRRLLDVWRTLQVPDGVDVAFLVVDNDAAASARPLVESYAGVRYVVEAEPGIPAARNRALDIALTDSSDLLCFVDDDAYPDAHWLTELAACWRAAGAALTFGPVRLTAPDGLRAPLRRLLARSIVARAAFLERYSARRAAHGQTVTSGTGNWMADVAWVRRNGIRFDAARTGGGEDSAFREAVRARGGRMAWCGRAVVYEGLAPERVSIRYQFRRARAHGINAAGLGSRPRVALLRHPIGRIVAGVALMVLPVLGAASFALGLHQVGMGVGQLQAHRGARSALYRR